jgi:phosphopantothenoylcysteine decarboxylase/phosphopantothenate--cysteine ligase
MIAPAMNVAMWENSATRENISTLRGRGVEVVGPNEGDMACGEFGFGRMAEPLETVAALEAYFGVAAPLSGRTALVTSGPTWEPIDPVRYIANRSSGRQGHAIAAALAGLGATVTLVTGPADLPPPAGVHIVDIESAVQMHEACKAALPVDIAVCAAAVGDWRVTTQASDKIKKADTGADVNSLSLNLSENPDILQHISTGDERPKLVVGFAAETTNLLENARAKLAAKGCDWIIANEVGPDTGVFGGTENTVHLVTADSAEPWPKMSKQDVARRLASRIADTFGNKRGQGGSVAHLEPGRGKQAG